MRGLLVIVCALIFTTGIGFEASAQSRTKNAPNSGVCPDGKQVRDLATCSANSSPGQKASTKSKKKG